MRFLEFVREYELALALTRFPSPVLQGRQRCKVLEIGAGTGQQAKRISEAGYEVMAIDVKSSHYRSARVFDVKEYDGISIPAADGTFDVVFSSNVLEHVVNIDSFLDETLRVMANGGVAIHILPTAATRFWSIPAHYAWLMKRIFARMSSSNAHGNTTHAPPKPRTPSNIREWLATLFPMRHGERGNTLTEIFYFSRWWWVQKFSAHGFRIVSISANHLFYTLANSMTDIISLPMRERLSTLLGSACTIYVIKRA